MRTRALIAACGVVFGAGVARTAEAYSEETFSLVPPSEQEDSTVDEEQGPAEVDDTGEIHAQDPESWHASCPSTGHYNPGPLEDVTLP